MSQIRPESYQEFINSLNKYTIMVYGTLKQGQPNHDIIANSPYLGEAVTNNNFALYKTSGIPFLVHQDKGGGVFGELYKVDKKTLKMLDVLESEGSLYDRELITVYEVESGHEIEVYAYIYNHSVRNFKRIKTFPEKIND